MCAIRGSQRRTVARDTPKIRAASIIRKCLSTPDSLDTFMDTGSLPFIFMGFFIENSALGFFSQQVSAACFSLSSPDNKKAAIFGRSVRHIVTTFANTT